MLCYWSSKTPWACVMCNRLSSFNTVTESRFGYCFVCEGAKRALTTNPGTHPEMASGNSVSRSGYGNMIVMNTRVGNHGRHLLDSHPSTPRGQGWTLLLIYSICFHDGWLDDRACGWNIAAQSTFYIFPLDHSLITDWREWPSDQVDLQAYPHNK